MHVELEDWKNGWSGISIGIANEEIKRLIELLQMLKTDPEQHFHILSDYKGQGNGGVGDIEVYVKTSEQQHNMNLSGRALGAGEEI